MQQVQDLMAGLYARACRAQGEVQDCSALAVEAVRLREVRPALPRLRRAGGAAEPRWRVRRRW